MQICCFFILCANNFFIEKFQCDSVILKFNIYILHIDINVFTLYISEMENILLHCHKGIFVLYKFK